MHIVLFMTMVTACAETVTLVLSRILFNPVWIIIAIMKSAAVLGLLQRSQEKSESEVNDDLLSVPVLDCTKLCTVIEGTRVYTIGRKKGLPRQKTTAQQTSIWKGK